MEKLYSNGSQSVSTENYIISNYWFFGSNKIVMYQNIFSYGHCLKY